MEKYTRFDYDKVLAVLRALSDSLKSNNHEKVDDEDFRNYYKIHIKTFDAKESSFVSFDVKELIMIDSFENMFKFPLLKASFELGKSEPLLIFTMGTQCCNLKVKTFNDKFEEEIFDGILPTFEIRNSSWEETLSEFVLKVKFVVERKLRAAETLV